MKFKFKKKSGILRVWEISRNTQIGKIVQLENISISIKNVHKFFRKPIKKNYKLFVITISLSPICTKNFQSRILSNIIYTPKAK